MAITDDSGHSVYESGGTASNQVRSLHAAVQGFSGNVRALRAWLYTAHSNASASGMCSSGCSISLPWSYRGACADASIAKLLGSFLFPHLFDG